MQRRIDLNCDMGESFGAWRMGDDAGVMPWITSANIACGFHAGDSETLRETTRLAHSHGVAIGAHVGLPDLAGFGRREMRVDPAQVYAYTLHQLGALDGFARVVGTRVGHVKAHGALYHMVARDAGLAVAMVRAARDFDARLQVYGPAPSALAVACAHAQMRFLPEGFVDRRYGSNGRLLPRGQPGAVIDSVEDAVAQALTFLNPGLRGVASEFAQMRIDTLCLHGDRTDAAAFAQGVRLALEREGIAVRSTAEPADLVDQDVPIPPESLQGRARSGTIGASDGAAADEDDAAAGGPA